jgi:large subunit ribosomal protein L13
VKTTTLPPSAPAWHLIDADGQSLGKVAVKAAHVLRGKHKATFSPHQNCGDCVVIINAGKIALPPKKGMRKIYHRHTGFPGNMKHATLDQMMVKKPTFAIENAIKGMLDDNRLRREILKRLHVFAAGEHPFAAQKPQPLALSRPQS